MTQRQASRQVRRRRQARRARVDLLMGVAILVAVALLLQSGAWFDLLEPLSRAFAEGLIGQPE